MIYYGYYDQVMDSHLHPFDLDAPGSGGIVQIGLRKIKKRSTVDTYISTLSTFMPHAVVASSRTT